MVDDYVHGNVHRAAEFTGLDMDDETVEAAIRGLVMLLDGAAGRLKLSLPG